MFSITRLLWFAGYIHVSYPTLTSGSRFFHTLLLYLYVFHRVTLRLQMRAADRSHPCVESLIVLAMHRRIERTDLPTHIQQVHPRSKLEVSLGSTLSQIEKGAILGTLDMV